jgi:4-hydroxybutyryl-CoA dehydratase/vinylacetyl-CoA-Delta-isomerase
MVGAATLMARANGLSARTFSDKLVNMSINNQVTFGLGVGACTLGTRHPSGSFIADPLTAHTNKVMVATLPYETKRLNQEIGGGMVETGCMPSAKDLAHAEYGALLREYYKAGAGSAETRLKAARLSEWLTIGGGVPGCMHGGGSPDGAKLTVRVATPIEEYVDYARKVMGIEEEVPEPQKKK